MTLIKNDNSFDRYLKELQKQPVPTITYFDRSEEEKKVHADLLKEELFKTKLKRICMGIVIGFVVGLICGVPLTFWISPLFQK